jgi:hypothetical protein
LCAECLVSQASIVCIMEGRWHLYKMQCCSIIGKTAWVGGYNSVTGQQTNMAEIQTSHLGSCLQRKPIFMLMERLIVKTYATGVMPTRIRWAP